MLGINSEEGFREILPGIEIKTINYGESMLMAKFRMEKGAVLPAHDHPYEQTGYLIRGVIRISGPDGIRECNPGDSWSIPAGAVHQAEILEDAVALEVFYPVREDYRVYLHQRDVIR
ncbi:MAG: cupin domain-containing protein [Candidatus Delongbacteria bacterium]|nr:cupin domain-containing protein [Candidatus Delongbacteria bacterium]